MFFRVQVIVRLFRARGLLLSAPNVAYPHVLFEKQDVHFEPSGTPIRPENGVRSAGVSLCPFKHRWCIAMPFARAAPPCLGAFFKGRC